MSINLTLGYQTTKSFQDFNNIQQVNIYNLFENGELERVKFPFKNSISEGVIFIHEGNKKWRFGFLDLASTVRGPAPGTR